MNKKEKVITDDCLCGGCCMPRVCRRCGFNKDEDARRKQIELTLNAKGLLRKQIPPKPETTSQIKAGGL